MARLSIDVAIIPRIAGGAFNSVIASFNATANKLREQATGAFSTLSKSFAEGQKAANEGGGMLGNLASRLGELATPLGAVTAALGLFTVALTATIAKGQEFEKNLQNVSAITGITGNGLNQLSNSARTLAKEFGGSATDQLKTFQVVLSKLGPDLAKNTGALSEVTKNINLLSKAGQLDAVTATEAVSNALLQFKVNVADADTAARESGRFANVIAASARVGAAEIRQVNEAILQAGVAASQLNISFEETNAAIQALAVGGKQGAEAGVGLRNVLTSLVTGGQKQEDLLNSIGLSYQKLGKVLSEQGLASALELLRNGFNKFSSDADKAAALAQLFGKENLSSAGILLGQVDVIKKWTKEITGTNDALTQASKNMDTFSDRVGRIRASIEDVAIGVFMSIAPAINGAIDEIGKALATVGEVISPSFATLKNTLGTAFTNIFEALKPVLTVAGGAIMTGLVASLTTVAETFNLIYRVVGEVAKSIVDVFSGIAQAFGIFGDNTQKTAEPMQLFANGLKGVASVISFVMKQLGDFAVFLVRIVATPIKLLVSLVAELAAWFIKLSPLGQSVVGVFRMISSALQSTANAQLQSAENGARYIQQQIESNAQAQKSVQATQSLVAEFKSLASQQTTTTKESARLREIQQQLDKQYPSLIDQTKSFKENLGGVAKIGELTTASMSTLTKQGEQLGKQLEQATKNIQFARRNVAIDELRDSLGSFSLLGIGNENKFRSEFAKIREAYVNELFGAKTIADVESAQNKILDSFNSLQSQGLFKDSAKIEELYKKIFDAASATSATIAQTNKDASKSAENSAQAVKQFGTVKADQARLEKESARDARANSRAQKEQAKTEKDILKDRIEAAKDAAKIAQQNFEIGLRDRALQENRKLSAKEELAISLTYTEELGKQLTQLQKQYKATVENGRVSNIGLKLDPKNVGDVINGLNDLVADVQKQRILVLKKSDSDELIKEVRETLSDVQKEIDNLPLSVFAPAKETTDAVAEAFKKQPAVVPITPSVNAEKLNDDIRKNVKPRIDIDILPERKSSVTSFANEIAKTLDDAVKRFEQGLNSAITKFKASVQKQNESSGFVKSSFSTIAAGAEADINEFASKLQAEGLTERFTERLRSQKEKLQEVLLATTDEEERAKLQQQLADLEKIQLEVLGRINAKQSEYSQKRKEIEIALIEDEAQREIAQKILSLERQKEAEIRSAEEVGLATVDIARKYNRQINQLRRDADLARAQENITAVERAVASTASILTESMSAPFQRITEEQRNQVRENLAGIEREKNEVTKKFLSQGMKATEYYAKIDELNKRSQEEQAKLKPPDIWDSFKDSAQRAFAQIAEVQRNFFQQSLQRYSQSMASQSAINSQMADLQSKAEKARSENRISDAENYERQYEELLKQRNANEKSSGQITSEIFVSMGTVVASTLANAAFTGQNATKAVLASLFDMLQSAIPIFTAMIFGITSASPANIATLNTWGAVQFIALTATLQGLVALARNAAGFRKGGRVRGGEQLIRINEEGEEMVINHRTTKKNLKDFEIINRENLSIRDYVKKYKPEILSEVYGPNVQIPIYTYPQMQELRGSKSGKEHQLLAELNDNIVDVKNIMQARRTAKHDVVEVRASKDFETRRRRKHLSDIRRA